MHKITFNFQELGKSENFNKLNYRLTPSGLYTTLTLTKLSDTSVQVAPFTAYIKDDGSELGARVELTANETVAITNVVPYIILRLTWVNSVANDFELLASDFGSITSNDIILGFANFTGATLVDFSYDDQEKSVLIDDGSWLSGQITSINDSVDILNNEINDLNKDSYNINGIIENNLETISHYEIVDNSPPNNLVKYIGKDQIIYINSTTKFINKKSITYLGDGSEVSDIEAKTSSLAYIGNNYCVFQEYNSPYRFIKQNLNDITDTTIIWTPSSSTSSTFCYVGNDLLVYSNQDDSGYLYIKSTNDALVGSKLTLSAGIHPIYVGGDYIVYRKTANNYLYKADITSLGSDGTQISSIDANSNVAPIYLGRNLIMFQSLSLADTYIHDINEINSGYQVYPDSAYYYKADYIGNDKIVYIESSGAIHIADLRKLIVNIDTAVHTWVTMANMKIPFVDPSTGKIYQTMTYANFKPIVTAFQITPDDTHIPSEKLVKDQLDLKLDDSQLVTAFQVTPDDTHIASEKLVKDQLDLKSDLIDIFTKSGKSTIRTGINGFHDASVALPVAPVHADTWVCSVAGNGWTLNRIYIYNSYTSTWEETQEGTIYRFIDNNGILYKWFTATSAWIEDNSINYSAYGTRSGLSKVINSINGFHDASVALPTSTEGHVWVCSVAGNGWVKDNIYLYSLAAYQWFSISPTTNYTFYYNTYKYIWSGSNWVIEPPIARTISSPLVEVPGSDSLIIHEITVPASTLLTVTSYGISRINGAAPDSDVKIQLFEYGGAELNSTYARNTDLTSTNTFAAAKVVQFKIVNGNAGAEQVTAFVCYTLTAV